MEASNKKYLTYGLTTHMVDLHPETCTPLVLLHWACYGFLYPYNILNQLGTWVCIWLLPHAVKKPYYLTYSLSCYCMLSGSHDLTVM